MRHVLLAMGAMAALSALVLQSVRSQPGAATQAPRGNPSGQNEGKARAAVDHTADEAAIRANIEQFVKAYNAGDAKAVAALFTADGQIEDKDGNVSEGREAIAKTFGELFAATPKKRIEVSVESIRFIGADLAM